MQEKIGKHQFLMAEKLSQLVTKLFILSKEIKYINCFHFKVMI